MLVASAAAYGVLAYGVDRVAAKYFDQPYEFPLFYAMLALAFGAYLLLTFKWKVDFKWKEILIWAAIFRCVGFLAMPNLSDDYFRFAWDGQLTLHGVNPYVNKPDTIIDSAFVQEIPGMQALYDGMNSKQFNTVYPPINQAMFTTAAWIGGESIYGQVLVMRSFILLADLGTVFLLVLLLRHFKRREHLALIYAFNPLVIVELSGNLHFEGAMLFFVALALYWLVKAKNALSAISMAFAIGIKLVPFMLLPFLIRRIGWKQSIIYYCITGLVLVVMFLPFINMQLIENFSGSINLYFQVLEFNASLFYIVKWLHIEIIGWDPVRFVGPIFQVTTLVLVLRMAFVRKHNWEQLFQKMLLALFIYYAFAIIVHPWYVSSLLMLSVLAGYRFPVLWSGLILLSYFAYLTPEYHENLWVVTLEYLAVYGLFFYEYRKHRFSLMEVQPTT